MFRCVATLVLATLLGVPAARAADTTAVQPGPWQVDWVFALNLSQSSFSENWRGGDKGSVVWVATSDTKAERQFTRKYNLSNNLKLAYGQALQQRDDPDDPNQLVWASPVKSNDLILFESVSRFTLGGWVDPYAALRLDSQFRDESSPLGSITLSPIKLTQSAGVARVLQKTEDSETLTRVGFGFRETFARQFDPGTGEKVSVRTTDGGFEWQTSATRPLLAKRVLYKGQLRVFQPVFFSDEAELEEFDRDALLFDPARQAVADYWRSPNVDFQNLFTAQITKLLSVSLAAQWVYLKFDPGTRVDNSKPIAERIVAVDHGVRRAGQFREALAIGLSYQLF